MGEITSAPKNAETNIDPGDGGLVLAEGSPFVSTRAEEQIRADIVGVRGAASCHF